MKFLIDEKGNKYVPESSVITVEIIKNVLTSEFGYLTDGLCNDMINAFQSVTEPKTENSEKLPVCNSKTLERTNIKGIDDDGHLIYKRGCSHKSKWSLDQVASIQAKLNGDYSKTLSRKDKEEIMDRLDLNESSLKTILHNLKYGELEEMVREWQMKNNYGIKKQTAPIENNPEKRRENGFGGIL